jgi:hypothetical protein
MCSFEDMDITQKCTNMNQGITTNYSNNIGGHMGENGFEN